MVICLFDENLSFEQIGEKLVEQNETLKNTLRKSLTIDDDIEFDQLIDVLSKHLESSSVNREEYEQLQVNFVNLTGQFSRLEEANRAWEQFHQNQLKVFRDLLEHWISFDEQMNLEEMAQQISIEFDRLTQNENQAETIESLKQQIEKYQIDAQNVGDLNEKLNNVYQNCDELREQNEFLQKQIDERNVKNQTLQQKLEELLHRPSIQRVESPREVRSAAQLRSIRF